MKTGVRYQAFHDPIFWFGVALYLLNKFWLQSHFQSAFLKGYVTDLLAIPIGLPILIWLFQKLELRGELAPRIWEVLALVLVCSLLFEVILPPISTFEKFGDGDILDVLAYAVGGVIGIVWWKLRERTYEPHLSP